MSTWKHTTRAAATSCAHGSAAAAVSYFFAASATGRANRAEPGGAPLGRLLRRAGLLTVWTLGLAACGDGASTSPLAGNLLAAPDVRVEGRSSHPERLADGLLPPEGDAWLTDRTVRLPAASALTWDLGAERPLRCLLLQGDNNDRYTLAGSSDGQSWKDLWTAEPERRAGMRLRQTRIEARARHLRLSAAGGDGLYSLGEVAVFSDCPAGWPALSLPRATGRTAQERAQKLLLLFAAAAVFFLLVNRKGGPRWTLALAALPLATGGLAIWSLVEIYPFANSMEESLVRGIVALLAGVVVVKESLLGGRFAPERGVARATLVVLALAAVGCYYHFGSAQFHDHAKGRRTFVHTFDMRHYFPSAKYFSELRFDGLYLASLAAYVDVTGIPPTSPALANSPLRSLTTYKMTTAAQAAPDLPAIRARFTPARWEEFKRDMKYLIDTMGPDYLGSMQDHGGNATPVWLLPAWLLFRDLPGNELTLSLAGLIDPLLLLLLFVVVQRTFGTRVMLYSVILFGASDFYQFGSNLMGSTLRQDWLVALGLGACALARGRYLLGGGLLAYGGLIRAFPALAALFLMVPIFWWLVDRWRERRRGALLAALRAEQGATLRAVAGAAITVVGLVALSAAVFGPRASWGEWFSKIEMHAVGPSTNNVGLRNVLAWRPWDTAQAIAEERGGQAVWDEWDRRQVRNFAQVRLLFEVVNAIAFVLVLIAVRGRPLHQTALLGLLLLPWFFYPSNYYFHYVFLLPLAVALPGRGRGEDPQAERELGWVVAVVAALCVGQYFTNYDGWSDRRYTYQSMLLLAAFAAIQIPFGLRGWRTLRGETAAATAPAPPASPAG